MTPTTLDGSDRTALLGRSREALEELLGDRIDRRFRVDQIHHALHEEGVASLEEISTLSLDLRRRLGESFRVGRPKVVARRESADGTVKYLFRLEDGATVEAVDIPDDSRRTYCISSQAGCALGCRFCVTGYWGAGRNLGVWEVVGQVVAMSGGLDVQRSLNVVFMGMGEPLLNLETVRDSVDVLSEWISRRRITVSTVGLVPGIRSMAEWPDRPNLAVSLHAADDERRSAIMPVNRAYPLAELIDALRAYPLEGGRVLTIEYILIAGFNDSPGDADLLVRRLAGLRTKVNLIPVNPDPVLGPEMKPSSDEVVRVFRQRLADSGVVATVRQRRGDDVSGACGQLRAFGRDPRGFRRSSTVSL